MRIEETKLSAPSEEVVFPGEPIYVLRDKFDETFDSLVALYAHPEGEGSLERAIGRDRATLLLPHLAAEIKVLQNFVIRDILRVLSPVVMSRLSYGDFGQFLEEFLSTETDAIKEAVAQSVEDNLGIPFQKIKNTKGELVSFTRAEQIEVLQIVEKDFKMYAIAAGTFLAKAFMLVLRRHWDINGLRELSEIRDEANQNEQTMPTPKAYQYTERLLGSAEKKLLEVFSHL